MPRPATLAALLCWWQHPREVGTLVALPTCYSPAPKWFAVVDVIPSQDV